MNSTSVQQDVLAFLGDPATYGGVPAVPIGQWRRQVAAIIRLGRRKVAKDE